VGLDGGHKMNNDLEKSVKINSFRIFIGVVIFVFVILLLLLFNMNSKYSQLENSYASLANDKQNISQENTNLRNQNQALRSENGTLKSENNALKTQLAQISQPRSPQTNTSSANITTNQNAGIDFQITVEQLMSEFDTNDLGAEMKYKNKVLAVTGVIKEIRRSTFGNTPLVILRGSKNPFLDFAGHFRESDLQTLANLKNGQRVTIIGTLTSQYRLDNCTIK